MPFSRAWRTGKREGALVIDASCSRRARSCRRFTPSPCRPASPRPRPQCPGPRRAPAGVGRRRGRRGDHHVADGHPPARRNDHHLVPCRWLGVIRARRSTPSSRRRRTGRSARLGWATSRAPSARRNSRKCRSAFGVADLPGASSRRKSRGTRSGPRRAGCALWTGVRRQVLLDHGEVGVDRVDAGSPAQLLVLAHDVGPLSRTKQSRGRARRLASGRREVPSYSCCETSISPGDARSPVPARVCCCWASVALAAASSVSYGRG